MKIAIKVFGSFLEHPFGSENASFYLFLENPTTLSHLVNEVLNLQGHDKIVLVKNRYVKPSYYLKDGDTVEIYAPLAGG